MDLINGFGQVSLWVSVWICQPGQVGLEVRYFRFKVLGFKVLGFRILGF